MVILNHFYIDAFLLCEWEREAKQRERENIIYSMNEWKQNLKLLYNILTKLMIKKCLNNAINLKVLVKHLKIQQM